MQLEFRVPDLIPPSVNHYSLKKIRRRRDGTVYIAAMQSPEARAFKWAVSVYAKGRTVAPLPPEYRKVRYRVTIDVYLGPRQRGDADNFAKVCLDALQDAGVIHSDANVQTASVTVHKDDRSNPRTIFLVERIENAE
jgi:Holliday junction resolvase RusA-like endonuclease